MPQASLAAEFRERRLRGPVLVLPNAWDAGSARLMASLGARAVATTSSSVAWAHGHPDGDALPIGFHAEAARQIARAIEVPLSGVQPGGLRLGCRARCYVATSPSSAKSSKLPWAEA